MRVLTAGQVLNDDGVEKIRYRELLASKWPLADGRRVPEGFQQKPGFTRTKLHVVVMCIATKVRHGQ